MFAIIETGGKQYRVEVGQKVKVEKLDVTDSGAVVFDKVLLKANDNKVEIGQPYLAGAKVEGKVSKEGRSRKVIVFKYHSKTRRRKKKGHRQHFTEVLIEKI